MIINILKYLSIAISNLLAIKNVATTLPNGLPAALTLGC